MGEMLTALGGSNCEVMETRPVMQIGNLPGSASHPWAPPKASGSPCPASTPPDCLLGSAAFPHLRFSSSVHTVFPSPGLQLYTYSIAIERLLHTRHSSRLWDMALGKTGEFCHCQADSLGWHPGCSSPALAPKKLAIDSHHA